MCSWNDRPVTEAPKLKGETVSVQAELAGEWNPSKSASGHLLDHGAGPALQNVLVLVFSRDYNSLITTQGCGSAPWGKKPQNTGKNDDLESTELRMVNSPAHLYVIVVGVIWINNKICFQTADTSPVPTAPWLQALGTHNKLHLWTSCFRL